MASVYQPSYPYDTIFDLAIKKFLEMFYAMSDNPEVTAEAYADNFTDDATLVMGKNRAVGRSGLRFRSILAASEVLMIAEISALRRPMWNEVSARQHRPLMVFPFGSNAREVMLYGTVSYQMKDSRRTCIEWSARATFAVVDEAVRLEFYQVWL
jgi:hypothetical protein